MTLFMELQEISYKVSLLKKSDDLRNMIISFFFSMIAPIIRVINDAINSERIVTTLCKSKLKQLELNVHLFEK